MAPPRRPAASASAWAAIGLTLYAGADPVATRACAETIDRELTRLGISEQRIAEATLTPRLAGGMGRTRAADYRAWIDLVDCDGYLILVLDRNCRFRSATTRGACAIDGVPPARWPW